MERIYRRLEAWGYPQSGTDWLRRHRLAVVVGLAALSWSLTIAVMMGFFSLVAIL